MSRRSAASWRKRAQRKPSTGFWRRSSRRCRNASTRLPSRPAGNSPRRSSGWGQPSSPRPRRCAGRAQRAAHAFKSAAATIGARALAALLEQIEAAALAGDVAGARDKLERVRGEASAALAYLQTTVKGGGDG